MPKHHFTGYNQRKVKVSSYAQQSGAKIVYDFYLSELLQLFCKTHETKPIEAEHVRDELQDEVIGLEISKLRHFFTEGAWLLVCEKCKAYFYIPLLLFLYPSEAKEGGVEMWHVQ